MAKKIPEPTDSSSVESSAGQDEPRSEHMSNAPEAAAKKSESESLSASSSEGESESESETESACAKRIAAEAAAKKTVTPKAANVKSPAPKTPVRDDCWTEDATKTLIEEWGRHYEKRQKLDKEAWKSVAEAVNDVHGLERTEMQCKNRIDTVKKKYRLDKSKPFSSWPFFERMDSIITSSSQNPEKKSTGKGKKTPSSSSGQKPTGKKAEPRPEDNASEPPKKKQKKQDGSQPEDLAVPALELGVVLGELVEGSLVPQPVFSCALALLTQEQRDDFAAKFHRIFVSQIDLNAQRNVLLGDLNKLIHDVLNSKQ